MDRREFMQMALAAWGATAIGLPNIIGGEEDSEIIKCEGEYCVATGNPVIIRGPAKILGLWAFGVKGSRFKLIRDQGQTLFSVNISSYDGFRWDAEPGQEIIVRKSQSVRMEGEGHQLVLYRES